MVDDSEIQQLSETNPLIEVEPSFSSAVSELSPDFLHNVTPSWEARTLQSLRPPFFALQSSYVLCIL